MPLTKELRVSLCEADHAFLNAAALGAQEEMQSIVRDLIREFIAAKRHEIKVLGGFIESEGITTASRRSASGTGP